MSLDCLWRRILLVRHRKSLNDHERYQSKRYSNDFLNKNSDKSDNENKLSPERKAYKNQNTLSTKGMKTKNAMSPSGRQNTRKFSEDLNNSPLPSYENVTPKSKLQVPSTNAKSGGGFLSRLKTIGKSKKTDDEYRIDDYLEWK